MQKCKKIIGMINLLPQHVHDTDFIVPLDLPQSTVNSDSLQIQQSWTSEMNTTSLRSDLWPLRFLKNLWRWPGLAVQTWLCAVCLFSFVAAACPHWCLPLPPTSICSLTPHSSLPISLLGETNKPSMRNKASLPHIPYWHNRADSSWLMIYRQCGKQDAFHYTEGFPEMWQAGRQEMRWLMLTSWRQVSRLHHSSSVLTPPQRWVSSGMLMLGAQQPWNRSLYSLCGLINRG